MFQSPPSNAIAKAELVVIDAETTGLKRTDHIVTLGGVTVREQMIHLSEVLDQKYGYEKGSNAVTIHGELPQAVSLEVAYDVRFQEILSFLANRIIVGHHIAFDVAKINQLISEQYPGFSLKNQVIDTADLVYRLNPEQYDRSVGGRDALQLDQVCKAYQIPIENRHTALGDAFMTAQVLLVVLAKLEDRGIATIRELFR